MLTLLLTVTLAQDPMLEWNAWRGPVGTGVAPHANPPVSWSETQNVRWKTALPGLGHSTPIVTGGHVLVTTAVSVGDELQAAPERAPGAHDNAPVTHVQSFRVLSLDRSDGRVVWERTVGEQLPHERAHVTSSFASASPVTDGERVYAFFGSYGLYALSLEGEVLWSRDLGDMTVKHAHGEGAGPALGNGVLVVPWDHEDASFVVAFDAQTGEELWRDSRDEPTSWATPIVVEHEGRAQAVVSGTNAIRGYDLESGEELWSCGGLSHNVVASPLSAHGVVFAGSSYEHQALLAIALDGAEGDLTRSENLLWSRRRGGPYVPSPLLVDDTLYFLRHYQGVLHRVDAITGEDLSKPIKLAGIGNVYASPVAAAGRIYVPDLEGATVVLSHEEEPRVLAVNRLSDSFSASPALAGNDLYLRGERSLYCLSGPREVR